MDVTTDMSLTMFPPKMEFIDQNSEFLKDVIALGSKHSNTLGFMPVGGFIDHARKKWIIIAHKDHVLLGYLLFRLGLKNSKISIVHLCVNPEQRGNQISSKLLDVLKNKYFNSFAGIVLSCRKDYTEANRLWERYGFVSKKEIRSRSNDEKYLIKWWYDFNQTDLFNYYEQTSQKLRVLLDANVIIKLRDNHIVEHDEVKALLADWLSDEVEYYFAPEFYNEINRDPIRERAESTRKFIRLSFKEARLDKEECSKIREDLLKILPGTSENDNSDRKQLAECAASGIEYFITGDGPILSKRNEIQEMFDITILSPLEFILEIDKITSTISYHPSRLSGAIQITKKVDNKEIEKLIDKFLVKRQSESKHDFKNIVTKVLQNLKTSNIKIVTCPENGDLAFWGYILQSTSVEVPFFRFAENSLSQTLFAQLVAEIINLAIDNEKPFIEITDNYFCEYQEQILSDLGFVKITSSWHKIAIKGLLNSTELIQKFPFVGNYFGVDIFDKINQLENSELRTKLLLEIERKLFPLKFSDLDIPCYIIPIKPFWASQLFDKYISDSTIFGAKPEKIWNRENVYYRNVKPVTEIVPARILWYASSEKDFLRQKAIVGTSYLDNVSIDLVKRQYNKFKKYGIYEWKDLYKLANLNINNPVKALKFSDTEVFKNILPLSKITEILLSNNRKRNTFTSPLEVNNKVFNDVYKLSLE
jgi:ribosomal protein S18 acetylase RimI-like enzyme/predicted nucleic acid-binding protein